MRSALSLALSFAMFGVLAASANAGQRFSFNPGASSDALFSVDSAPPTPSVTNIDTAMGPFVVIQVNNFLPNGTYTGTTFDDAYYTLRSLTSSETPSSIVLSDDNRNDTIDFSLNGSGDFGSQGGLITFFSKKIPTEVLLQLSFGTSIFSANSGATSSMTGESSIIFQGGTRYKPTDTGNENFDFDFTNLADPRHPLNNSATFSSSTGVVGIVPTPEPATIAGLAFGALALLRRKRRP